MNDKTPRYIKVGDALSSLLNALLLPRHKHTNANESISGRAYRCQWKYAERFINTVCYLLKDHYRKAFESDLRRAKMLIEKYENTN